jgi:hypothetical protein
MQGMHRRVGTSGRTRRRATLVTLVALGATFATACRTGAPQPREANSATATLSVDNQTLNDRVIYVVIGGVRERIGIALGERTTNLTIPRAALNGATPLRFLADPMGGSGPEISRKILVYPGQKVTMQILSG